MLFDSHSHLHFHQFDDDREEIIKKLRDFNVKTINVGTDLKESKKAVNLAKKYPDLLWASVGLHPNDISTTSRRSSANGINNFEEDLQIKQLRELAKDEKVVAIGECGLDYYYGTRNMKHETDFKEKQKEIFKKQIEMANELKKPLILHCRPSAGSQDAYENAIEILKFQNFPPKADQPMAENIPIITGVAHFFSGSKETAKKFLDLGFYISFAGPITFHPAGGHPQGGASPYKELVQFIPIDRILIETDAPFAAPMPYRGRRNEPAYVEFVARQIAEWKGLSFEKVAEHTTLNALRLFKIR